MKTFNTISGLLYVAFGGFIFGEWCYRPTHPWHNLIGAPTFLILGCMKVLLTR